LLFVKPSAGDFYLLLLHQLTFPKKEAATVLKVSIGSGCAFTEDYFDVTAESSLEDFEREALSHSVFLAKRVADMRQKTAPV
jgi:hypothetical protein